MREAFTSRNMKWLQQSSRRTDVVELLKKAFEILKKQVFQQFENFFSDSGFTIPLEKPLMSN